MFILTGVVDTLTKSDHEEGHKKSRKCVDYQ